MFMRIRADGVFTGFNDQVLISNFRLWPQALRLSNLDGELLRQKVPDFGSVFNHLPYINSS